MSTYIARLRKHLQCFNASNVRRTDTSQG